jgi:uncharacterized membrane protein YqjE
VLKDTVLKFLKLDSLVEHITGYVETRIELLKVEIQEGVSKVLSKALVSVVIIAFVTLFVLLMSMALAFKLGESVGAFGGFAIVAAFYFLIGLIAFFFRDALAEKVETKLQDVIKKMKK